jgi:copper chaperone CopZ
MDLKKFQESITEELNVVKNRVRNLIGNIHWGEEGRYKEAILKNILRKFLPKNISVGTGFIVNSNNNNQISKQIDIIIYDNGCPVLFSEGDFIITTLKNVKGIIEVKSNIGNGNNTFHNVISQFDESIDPILNNIGNRKIFLGIFAFEFTGNIESQTIDENIRQSAKKVNHISLGKNHFIRKWKQQDANRLQPPVEGCNSDFYNIYEINNLSFSYFIANLIDIVCGGLNDRYWFPFPIQGTKEIHRVRTICLENA